MVGQRCCFVQSAHVVWAVLPARADTLAMVARCVSQVTSFMYN
jgi:hypothetical protein